MRGAGGGRMSETPNWKVEVHALPSMKPVITQNSSKKDEEYRVLGGKSQH